MGVNSIMNDAGRIGFVIKGDYSNTETYDFLDIAYFNGATYVAKKLTVGNTPDNTEFWHILVDGNIDVNDIAPTFLQAETRENINSGEKLPVIFGKIKKFFADLKTVAFTGSYNDLSNKPSASDIGAVATSKVLDTAELISANTASGNVAGALAVKLIKNDLENSISTLNSNFNNIGKQTTIISEDTSIGQGDVLTPSVDPNQFDYFIMSANWMNTCIVRKRWASATQDVVEASYSVIDGSVTVIRCLRFLIDRTSGKITIHKMNQCNIQTDGSYPFEIERTTGIGLYGLVF